MLPRVSTSARKSDADKSRKRRIAVTWFMALIMVSSILGFIIVDRASPSQDLGYNDFKVESTPSGYRIELEGGRSIVTANHPQALEAVQVEPVVWKVLTQSPVIAITYNQSEERADSLALAQFLLEKNVVASSGIFVQRGLFNASGTGLMNLTCQDAKPALPVIVLEIGDHTGAAVNGSCIRVFGIVGQDVQQVSDRLVLGLAGVMPRGS